MSFVHLALWCAICILDKCPRLRGTWGVRLTSLFGNNDSIPCVAAKKKRTLLPLLTFVFVISYGLMTFLIVEQGAAIQAQHNLIQILLGDSLELWSMKGKALSDKYAHNHSQSPAPNAPMTQGQSSSTQTPSTQTPSTQAPSTQTPSGRTPLTQAPSTQTPSTRTPLNKVPQRHSQSRAGKGAKPDTQVPPMPASDLGDQRRVLITL